MPVIDSLNELGKRWRSRYLGWLFAGLARLHFTPNTLTFLRFLSAPAFILFFPTYPRKMTLVLAIACAIDWIDGGLARYLKMESDRGKFWDVLVDHIVYVAAIFTLMRTGAFSFDAMAYQLMIAPVTFLLATIKESETRATDWIIHPYYTIVYYKPFALLALFAYVGWGINVVDVVVLLINVLMTITAAYHAFIISRRWAN